MVTFNNIPAKEIIYTSCENEAARIPEATNIFNYLRDFFVDSYSDEKLLVLYITSSEMDRSWYAVTEVGAGWITKMEHKIFNIGDYTPKRPLDTSAEWQTSTLKDENIEMSNIEFDKFIVKILDVCKKLGIDSKSKAANKKELKKYIILN